MTDLPSDIDNDFLKDETQKDLTERIMAALAERKKETRKEQKAPKKAKKPPVKEAKKAEPKKPTKPKPSADPDKTRKDLTERIRAALEKKKKETKEEPKKPKKTGAKEDKKSAKQKRAVESKPPKKEDKDLTDRIMAAMAKKKQEVTKPEAKKDPETPESSPGPREKPKIKDPKKIRALIKAVKKGKFEKVKRLAEEEGVDVNEPDKDGRTPLLEGVGNGNVDVIKLLLENGARPVSKHLEIACQTGDETIIRLLESKMADTEVMNKMESILSQKSPKQEQPVTRRATPLEPESFSRLHNGRSPIREVPSDAPLPKETAEASIELGFSSLEHGDIQSAEVYFKKALALEPNNITALTNLGFVLCKQGKYESAEIPLTEALKLCSDIQESAIIHKNLAIALFKQDKIRSAGNQVRAALKINPNDADAQKLEAIIAQQRKSDEERFQVATRKQIKPAPAEGNEPVEPVETKTPAMPPAGAQSAEKSVPVSSGDQFFGLLKPNEAPRELITEEITSADQAIALANRSAQKDDHESAEKYLKKAIELNPHNELAHRTLGYVYEMLASRAEEQGNKNIYLSKAKEETEKADKLKAAADKQADEGYKAPDTGQIDALFSPFDNGPAEPVPESQPSPSQPQPVKQKNDVQPGLRGQERGATKEEQKIIRKRGAERLKYLCKVILTEDPSSRGWQEAVTGYTALISQKPNLYIKSVNHRAVAVKLREAYEKGHLADYIPAIIAHTQDVLINKNDFEARAEAGLTHLKANQLGAAVRLFEDTLLLNPNPTGKYAWVKGYLEELKTKMLTPHSSEAKQQEGFECPPTVKQAMPQQDSSQLQPGEERVRIEGLPEDQVPKPVPAVPPASTSTPPPLPPFTDREWEIGELKESDTVLKEHEQEQSRPPVPPTLPSIEIIPQMAEKERKLKLTEVQEQFTSGSRTFASIVLNFTEISPEQIDELDKWVKRYTKLLLENPKAQFPHNATRDHLISLQERGWVSNETMMGFMGALKKHEALKKTE